RRTYSSLRARQKARKCMAARAAVPTGRKMPPSKAAVLPSRNRMRWNFFAADPRSASILFADDVESRRAGHADFSLNAFPGGMSRIIAISSQSFRVIEFHADTVNPLSFTVSDRSLQLPYPNSFQSGDLSDEFRRRFLEVIEVLRR